jgi:UMF1 family MFS transporter
MRRAVWSWMFFDWASQPFYTLLITFIFAPYFTSAVMADPAEGQALWGYANAAAGFVIALLAPVLGALADTTGPRKPWIAAFSIATIAGSALLWFAEPGMADPTPILLAFAIGLVGIEFASSFNSAMLPDLGPKEAVGRISGSGWALGYVGGLLALVLMLVFMVASPESGRTMAGLEPLFGLDPAAREGDRAAGPLTALWYAVFVLPLFLFVPDTPRRAGERGAVRRALRDLGRTIRGLPGHPGLLGFLAGSSLYRDALNGIYAFGGIYAAGVLGWSITQIGVFGILAAAAGAAGCWVGGRADSAFGPRPVIVVSVLALIAVCTVIVATSREAVFGIPLAPGSGLPDTLFYICGGVIGAAGGALQASSRTMLVYEAEPGRMTEAFGLYALTGKATSFLSPLLIALATDLTQSQRLGIAPVVLLLAAGLALLLLVRRRSALSAA